MKFKYLFHYLNIVTVLFAFSSIYLFAEEIGIHTQIDELIQQKKFSIAEAKAKEYLKMHPNDVEGMCALACVYRNQSLKSGIVINTDAMGIKEGESGTYEIKDSSEVSRLFKDRQYYERTEYRKAEELYYNIISIEPSYQNAYFNLLNDYVTLNEFDNYFKVIELFIQNNLLYGPGKAANAGGVSVSGLEMSQNSMRLAWSRKEVDERLHRIMESIHKTCMETAEQYGTPGNYVNGANIAGFVKVVDAMLDQGLV